MNWEVIDTQSDVDCGGGDGEGPGSLSGAATITHHSAHAAHWHAHTHATPTVLIMLDLHLDVHTVTCARRLHGHHATVDRPPLCFISFMKLVHTKNSFVPFLHQSLHLADSD